MTNTSRWGIEFKVPAKPAAVAFVAGNPDTWERDTLDVFMRQPRGRLAIDIGAWIGVTAHMLASRFDNVVAYEPDPVAFDVLLDMLALNEDANVTAVHAAVVGVGQPCGGLMSRGDYGNSQSHVVAAGGLPLHTAPVASIIAANPDFVKCDVEGGEEWLIEPLLALPCALHISMHQGWWTAHTARDIGTLLVASGRRMLVDGRECPDIAARLDAPEFCAVYVEHA